VWVKSWGEIIQENEARLTYLKKQLQYRADEASGIAHLQETYDKYIPPLRAASADLQLRAEDDNSNPVEDSPKP
jgi:hypothetical protein